MNFWNVITSLSHFVANRFLFREYVSKMYVIIGLLTAYSLVNKEIWIFDNGNYSLYIESTSWLLRREKKRQMCFIEIERAWILAGDCLEVRAKHDLWLVAPIQQRLWKETMSLPVLFLWLYGIAGFTFHFVSLPFSVTVCHNCLLVYRGFFFSFLKHPK